ncbi:MAG: choloylglycine hydrolase family protein [Candidatus Eremiobacteraeota bacterium]|nr:choloylglycine hydrolase family protein [Candidatus Eremiobacteraeota bacterium]
MVRNLSFFHILLLVCALLIATQGEASACTGISVKLADGTCVHGRTLEFGVEVICSIAFVPRAFEFAGSVPGGGPGMKYKAKYASLGSINYGNLAIMDGINEKGLSVGAFYFSTCAEYAPLTEKNRASALSPVDFPNWILTQFATIDEVRSAIEQGKVAVVPTPVNGWGPAAPPLHYIVYDKAGKSIVIEPVGGKLRIFENPLGVITNSPGFDYMITNLRNYIHLSTVNVASLTMGGLTLLPCGQGTGMVGLPGDYTPPSRFVRAAFFSANAVPVKDVTEGIFQVFHILNNFDIPRGITSSTDGGTVYYDYTQATVARDPRNLRYYLRMYGDQTIRMADLKKFDLDSARALTVSTMEFRQSVVDITPELKPVK